MSAYLVLNTDASKPGPKTNPSGEASIGVVLRQRTRSSDPIVVVAYISRKIDHPVSIQEAEYLALIEGLKLVEGLKLAREHAPTDLYAYVDSSPVARQVDAKAPRIKAYMKPLHEEVRNLREELGGEEHVTISWVPREMNVEADQRAADAFLPDRSNGQ